MATKIISAIILDENSELTLEQISHTIQIEQDVIIEMVEYELITPKGQAPQDWRFDTECLARAKKAQRLLHDLEINYPGVALAFDLLDKIEKLEAQIKKLEK